MMVSFTKPEFEARYGKGSAKLLLGEPETFCTPHIKAQCLANRPKSIFTREFAISKTNGSELYYSLDIEWWIHHKDKTKEVRAQIRKLYFYPSFIEYHEAARKCKDTAQPVNLN